MSIYRRHTLAHHQFFTEREPSIDSLRDFRITFFPPYALIALLAMTLPGAGILYLAGAQNACWLLLCTAAGLYLNYELFHYLCHVKDDRLVRHIPGPGSARAPLQRLRLPLREDQPQAGAGHAG